MLLINWMCCLNMIFEDWSEYHLSMNLEFRRLVLMVVGFSRISWKILHEQLLMCSTGCLRKQPITYSTQILGPEWYTNIISSFFPFSWNCSWDDHGEIRYGQPAFFRNMYWIIEASPTGTHHKFGKSTTLPDFWSNNCTARF